MHTNPQKCMNLSLKMELQNFDKFFFLIVLKNSVWHLIKMQYFSFVSLLKGIYDMMMK